MKWHAYQEKFIKQAKSHGLTREDIEICLLYAERLYTQNLPIIYEQEHFAQLVGVKYEYVLAASNSPTGFYRTYRIPKKSGGVRWISEPLPTLKKIQRWILDEILSQMDYSPFAKAYISGRGIKENARFHRKQNVVFSIDLKNFFGSIKNKTIFPIFSEVGYSPAVAKLLTEICCLKGSLPQGAPTSPALSNLVMRGLDARIGGFSKKYGIRYTRYADDMTFSGFFEPGMIVCFLEQILSNTDLEINHKKTRSRYSYQQQEVTGIVVNEKMQAPKKLRRKIRQEVYYIKRYGLDSHLARLNINTPNYLEKLIGFVSYALYINPNDTNLENQLNYLTELKKHDR